MAYWVRLRWLCYDYVGLHYSVSVASINHAVVKTMMGYCWHHGGTEASTIVVTTMVTM